MSPELLSPAGTLKHLRYAFAYGADAVYAGQPRYSLRVRNNDFDLAHLETGIHEAHQQGKRFYVASNIAPHNSKVKTYMRDMAPIIEMQPDALIMSDPGLIMMVQERWPEVEIHLSVQANVVNYAAAKFWQKMGIARIILSRELSLDEVAEFRQECPDLELEVFVHGALCMAYSGRCLLSGYVNHRDPNQGACTNACRWEYEAQPAVETSTGEIVPKAVPKKVQPQLGQGDTVDEVYLLREKGRPDQLMPAFEDEHGTYIMNSKDLRAVHHVQRLTEMGVHSLKIEGRTKSHYYAARTTQVYRQAIDDAVAGRVFNDTLMETLEKLSHRGYTEGFFRRHVHDAYQNYERGNSVADHQIFVGEIVDYDTQSQLATVDVKNRFAQGDSLELMTPKGNQVFTLSNMRSQHGQDQAVAPGSGHIVKIPIEGYEVMEHALLLRNLTREESLST